LSYNFGRSLLSKTRVLANARIFASVNNLFYITNFTGPTPEPPTVNGVTTGVYTGTYPTAKSFVLGAHITF